MTTLETAILKTILELGPDAYGAKIRPAVQSACGRFLSIGKLYATLESLEDRGFVYSWEESGGTERAGRVRRCFRVQNLGLEALGLEVIK